MTNSTASTIALGAEGNHRLKPDGGLVAAATAVTTIGTSLGGWVRLMLENVILNMRIIAADVKGDLVGVIA